MNASWIAPENSGHEKNYYFRTRKIFRLECRPETAPFHLSAESYYLLTVNGRTVGRGPARGTHTVNYFDTWDLASELRPGDNEILILCQCMNVDDFVSAPAQPAVIAELDGFFGTDASWEVQPGTEWRQDVNPYTGQVGFAEWRDFRNRADRWEPAQVLPPNSPVLTKRLLPRDVPELQETVYFPADLPVQAATPPLADADDKNIHKIFTYEKHTPLARNLKSLLQPGGGDTVITPLPDGGGIALVFDFDREIIGRFELDITAPSGTIVDLGHDEELWNRRIKTDHSQEFYTFTDRYVLDGRRVVVGNTLHQRGFRMVQIVIRNLQGPAIIHGVRAVDARYPYPETGSFNSSDMLLNRLWQICRETLSACTTDVFTDCPWRERSFWVNDMIVENRTTLEMFGDLRVNARAFRMALSDAFDDGLIPGVCPCPRNKRVLILLPTDLYITEMLSDYYQYSGDAALVREMLPGLLKIIAVFRGWEDADGLLNPPPEYWNFFDWSYELNHFNFNGRQTSLMNYFYLMALKNLVRLGREVGDLTDFGWMEERIKNLPARITARFFKPDRRLLADVVDLNATGGRFSQLAHALALLADACTPELRTVAAKALVDPELLMPEYYFHFFIFQALNITGQGADALARIRKYWGEVVETGTPTIWEAGIHGHGKKAYGEDGSLCHGFATSPVDFLQAAVLGVQPKTPGFRTFTVAPQPFDLTFAEGRIPTPAGNITIRWEKQSDYLAVTLNVPPGLTAVTAAGDFAAGCHQFHLELPQSNQ